MTLQEKFLVLVDITEQLKKNLKAQQERLQEVMHQLGVNNYLQDSMGLGPVYKIYKPEGTFISFKDIDYKRTALEGERGGTVLSKKEAEEAGFVLRK